MKTLLLIIMISLTFTSIVSAEQATMNKAVASYSKTTTKKADEKQNQKYDIEEINRSLVRLSPNYLGNDPKSVYSAIKKRTVTEKKGEFETTKAFEKRLQAESQTPVLGKVGLNGTFAFQSEDAEISYSADNSEFTIVIKPWKISEPSDYTLAKLKDPSFKSTAFNPNAKVIPLNRERVGSKSYIASNNFGASTVVDESNYEVYELAIANYLEFPFRETITEEAQQRIKVWEQMLSKSGSYKHEPYITEYDKEWTVTDTVAANPEEAKNIKNNIRLLFIGKLDVPYIAESVIHRKPTMSSPTEFTSIIRYLYVKLEEIWIYNVSSGHIYSKIAAL